MNAKLLTPNMFLLVGTGKGIWPLKLYTVVREAKGATVNPGLSRKKWLLKCVWLCLCVSTVI